MSGEVAVAGGGARPATTYAAAGVDIEAGERAVELMKASVARATRPEVVGGLGGFAGLFDACALKALPAAAARDLDRRRRDQGRHRPADGRARHDRHRPGRHGRRRPRRLRRRAAVHDRLHRDRQGRARADRRDRHGDRRGLPAGRLRAGRRRDGRAPGAAGARRVRRRRRRHRRRRGRPAARPGPRAAPATSLVAMRVVGPALQRLLAGPPRAARPSAGLGAGPARRRARPHPRRGAARADPHLRPGLPGAGPSAASTCTRFSHVTGGGLAANLARVLPARPRGATSTASPGPRSRSSAWSARLGGVARPELERTLNMGVGMVAVAGRRRRSTARWPCCRAAGSTPGSCGEVRARRTASAATLPPRAAAAEPSR